MAIPTMSKSRWIANNAPEMPNVKTPIRSSVMCTGRSCRLRVYRRGHVREHEAISPGARAVGRVHATGRRLVCRRDRRTARLRVLPADRLWGGRPLHAQPLRRGRAGGGFTRTGATLDPDRAD